MTKQELLKRLHALLWRSDDMMDQDDLFHAQELVDREIIEEANAGRMKITQLQNGYIKSITVVKGW